MSVDIKDHRKFMQDKLRDVSKPEPALLEQADAPAQVGDARLDKLMRAVASLIEKHDEHFKQVSIAGLSQINDEKFRLHQAEYFLIKGKLMAFAEVMEIPNKIILEERGV